MKSKVKKGCLVQMEWRKTYFLFKNEYEVEDWEIEEA